MTFKDFNEQQKKIFNDWQNNRTKIALEAAVTATSISIDRVIETGDSSTGAKFGIYKKSTKKAKVRKGQTRSPYPNINYSDTNTMFRTTRAEIKTVTKDSVTISVFPHNKQRATVMGILNKKSISKGTGKIIALNKKEQSNLKEDYQNSLTEILKK